jgi:hypothetical protein
MTFRRNGLSGSLRLTFVLPCCYHSILHKGGAAILAAMAPPVLMRLGPFIQLVRGDTHMSATFIDKIASPIAGKVLECGYDFYIGQSRVVGGTTTDMVAYASHGVFVQIWIGAEDKLPRMARAR